MLRLGVGTFSCSTIANSAGFGISIADLVANSFVVNVAGGPYYAVYQATLGSYLFAPTTTCIGSGPAIGDGPIDLTATRSSILAGLIESFDFSVQ